MFRTTLTLLVASLLMLVAACTPNSGASSNLAGNNYQLVAIDGQPVDSALPEVTLNFGDDGAIGGSTSCNAYGGSYPIDGNTITFSEVFQTLMACLDDGVMELESAYTGFLNPSPHTFSLNGADLTLPAANGQTMQFVQMP